MSDSDARDPEIIEPQTPELGENDEVLITEDGENPLILSSDLLPERLVILPNVRRPFFPGMFLPVTLSPRAIKAIEFAKKDHGGHFGIVVSRNQELEEGDEVTFDDLYQYGVAARIIKALPISDDQTQAFVQVVKRFRMLEPMSEDPFLISEVEYLEDDIPEEMDQEFRATVLAVVAETKALIDQNPTYGEELKLVISKFSADQPGMLADFTAALTDNSLEEIQEILETLDVRERLKKTLKLLKQERKIVTLRNKISAQIEERISEKQREYFLHEQLKEIKKELGLEEEPQVIFGKEYKSRLKGKTVPDDVMEVIDEELKRLGMMDSRSPEFQNTRNYLDWLTVLPWGVKSRERVSLKRARKVLERDHYGMADVKERILEFIAVRAINKESKGGILCLQGPPGVGKTSIGKSIAEALGRKFYRFSVGGMRDEAEIKGHRRTYVGAMPGKVIQALKLLGTQNPVLMIDEIDKLAKGMQGDPASALLEVLDPEQNQSFLDHYLDVRFDLSDFLFICTANQLETIPRPLLDRMEVIQLPGYLDVEKVEIARRYLLPKQRKDHGMSADDLAVSRSALERIVSEHAREAGVRRLEQAMAKICRKVAMMMAEGRETKVKVTAANLHKFLGPPAIDNDELGTTERPGLVRGLAYTAMGGATLFIEATAAQAQKKGGSMRTTGQLGDVMSESATIAYTYAEAHAQAAGAPDGFFDAHKLHLHVPAGATPKDGPSAGISMATALISLAAGRSVRQDLAMTGELSLTGRVLPVGGIREKAMAAHRVGVRELIIPARNRPDVERLPQMLKDEIQFHLVQDMEEVWPLALKGGLGEL